MNELLFIAAFAVTLTMVVLWPQRASAHCDTMDGPTAKDGVKALATAGDGHGALWFRWRKHEARCDDAAG